MNRRDGLALDEDMKNKPEAAQDIDDYIARFPTDVQRILEKIRETIAKAAPDAAETIKYGMPTFTLEGNLVHFAAFKKHIGVFPPVKGDENFSKETSVYEGPKGNFRFPLDAPIPYGLVRKIVKLRIKENLERAQAKTKKR
jgi:uncharacterized protein YdhG (YjbR/CyaY superfamily)